MPVAFLAALTAGVAEPPVVPGGGIGAKAGAGDVLQSLEDPAAGGRVEGGVVHHLEEAGRREEFRLVW